ncbi:hypothetical protein ACU4GD_17435 [Cupriavidus basilensis]
MIGRAAGLALVQVGEAREIDHQEGAEFANGGERPRLAQRQAEFVCVCARDTAVELLDDAVQPIGGEVGKRRLGAGHG